MNTEGRDATLAHLRLVASYPGYWELRALRRVDAARMEPRGSFFVIAVDAGSGLVYDRLEEAVGWADLMARDGCELFIGMNPRAREGRDKAAVEQITSCYVDLDLPEGETVESAISQLTDGDVPPPSFCVHSGYGVHAVYLLRGPVADKAQWRAVQRGLLRRWEDLGADRKVAGDEARVLRLVPYPNRKRWPDGVPTEIVYTSDTRYDLAELAEAFGRGTSFSRLETLSGSRDLRPQPVEDLPDDLDSLIERHEYNRSLLAFWIKRNMRAGVHFGTYPVAGQDIEKPTLLKPGAEMVLQLFDWRCQFTADLDSLSMAGPNNGMLFAYVCRIIDRQDREIAQGRGASDLREPGMLNVNKAVKLAEKRAMVDAVLRAANLSEWFTQDLEELAFIAPELRPPASATDRIDPRKVNSIRLRLHQIRRSEREVVEHFGLRRIEDLDDATGDRLLARLEEIMRNGWKGA